jgi:hypothetical protein
MENILLLIYKSLPKQNAASCQSKQKKFFKKKQRNRTKKIKNKTASK